MIVYRLSKKDYRNDLSGKGAWLAGGRWNSKGTALLYTGQSRALCMSEVAVHLPYGVIPEDYFLVTIDIPQGSILEIAEQSLPEDWADFPHPASTQQIGDDFVRAGEYLVLKVPSVTVPGDFNYLVNPLHDLSYQLRIVLPPVLFTFDKRLFKTGPQDL
jgi:RES domain-containing protein